MVCKLLDQHPHLCAISGVLMGLILTSGLNVRPVCNFVWPQNNFTTILVL